MMAALRWWYMAGKMYFSDSPIHGPNKIFCVDLVINMNKTGAENDCGIITGVVPTSFWLFAFTLSPVRIPEVFAKVN